MEKLLEQAINPKIVNNFHTFMKFLVLVLATAIPIWVGYWRYQTCSDMPRWQGFIDGLIFSFPFSCGLILSTTKLGKNFQWPTFFLILPSAIVHILFVGSYGHVFLILLILIETYAIYSLFIEERHR